MKFFFTYGTDKKYPFIGGWTEVEAPNEEDVLGCFRGQHPDVVPGVPACGGIYNEFHFYETGMSKTGNFGHRLHERLVYEKPPSELEPPKAAKVNKP